MHFIIDEGDTFLFFDSEEHGVTLKVAVVSAEEVEGLDEFLPDIVLSGLPINEITAQRFSRDHKQLDIGVLKHYGRYEI